MEENILEETAIEEMVEETRNSQPEVEEEVTEEPFITEEAMRNAEKGIFKHTLLEAWLHSLNMLAQSNDGPLDIETASAILSNYPWLKHDDLQQYRVDRRARFLQAIEVLEGILGTEEHKAKLFSENIDDWNLHVDYYLQVIAGWHMLTQSWAKTWSEKKPHRVTHATIVDVSTQLINDEIGLISGIKTLANFEITEANRERLNQLTGESNE